MMDDYWSKQRYTQRIKEYNEEIKHVRAVAAHEKKKYGLYGAYEHTRNLLAALIQARDFHKLAYKVLKKGKQQ